MKIDRTNEIFFLALYVLGALGWAFMAGVRYAFAYAIGGLMMTLFFTSS